MKVDQGRAQRRITAARELRGWDHQDLADRLPAGDRLGARTVRKLQSGERVVHPRDVLAIARATELPEAFFLAPREELAQALDDHARLVREQAWSDMAGFVLTALDADRDQALATWLESVRSPPATDERGSGSDEAT